MVKTTNVVHSDIDSVEMILKKVKISQKNSDTLLEIKSKKNSRAKKDEKTNSGDKTDHNDTPGSKEISSRGNKSDDECLFEPKYKKRTLVKYQKYILAKFPYMNLEKQPIAIRLVLNKMLYVRPSLLPNRLIIYASGGNYFTFNSEYLEIIANQFITLNTLNCFSEKLVTKLIANINGQIRIKYKIIFVGLESLLSKIRHKTIDGPYGEFAYISYYRISGRCEIQVDVWRPKYYKILILAKIKEFKQIKPNEVRCVCRDFYTHNKINTPNWSKLIKGNNAK